MTRQISDQVRIQIKIKGLLEYRNLIEAIRVYRAATGCGLKEAKESVEQLRDQFRQEDPERFGGIDPARSNRGSTWTLIGGSAFLIAILSSVYAVVFPRFSVAPVSPTASLEIRMALPKPSERTSEMILPDGTIWHVDEEVLLSAPDFHAFKGRLGDDGVTRLTLMPSSTGRERLKRLKGLADDNVLGVIVHQQLIASVAMHQWSGDGMTISLTGLNNSDANQVLARLTE